MPFADAWHRDPFKSSSLFRCLIEENELREVNRRQLIRIEFLERDYRQLDDDLLELQNERDLLMKQKRMYGSIEVGRETKGIVLSFDRLEEEVDRSSHHASANVDLHVYTQRLENDCRDLRCQIAMREKEKFEYNEMFVDFEAQVGVLDLRYLRIEESDRDYELFPTESMRWISFRSSKDVIGKRSGEKHVLT